MNMCVDISILRQCNLSTTQTMQLSRQPDFVCPFPRGKDIERLVVRKQCRNFDKAMTVIDAVDPEDIVHLFGFGTVNLT